jgi:hypothetical protein
MTDKKYLTVWWCLTHDAHWREGDVACLAPGYEESGNDCEYATKVLLDGAAAGERMVVIVNERQWLDSCQLLVSWADRVSDPQCGQRYSATACGPTHAVIWNLTRLAVDALAGGSE